MNGMNMAARITLVGLLAATATAQVRPGDLLIYYSYPSQINGATTISQAAGEFAVYDIAVIGDGLQDGPGDPNPHPDHAATIQIINSSITDGTLFFGYIDLGVTTDNLPLSEIERRVDAWQAMGIDGIFLDDFGYDYGTTRIRQNDAVDYIHTKGLPVCANGWSPDDCFGSQVHANNPTGLATHLGASDYYLSESHQIIEGDYADETDWQYKANLLLAYQKQLGFKVISNTTPDVNSTFDQGKYDYAWFSAAQYGHVATAWSEWNYAATTSLAPYRTPPTDVLGLAFRSGVGKDGSDYTRRTTLGWIYVNAATHAAGFLANADEDGDGVDDFFDLCPGTPPGRAVKPNGSPLGDVDCNCTVDMADYAVMQRNYGN